MKEFALKLWLIAIILTFSLAPLSLELKAAEAEAVGEKKVPKIEPMGSFEKMNFMRKMIGPSIDLKSASENMEKANKEIKDEFTSDKLDETKLKLKVDEAKKAMKGFVAAMKSLFAVMGEFLSPDRIAHIKAREAKKPKSIEKELMEEEKIEPVQIPASFSEEQIKKIRAMKAKNLPRWEAIHSSANLQKMDIMYEFMKDPSKDTNSIIMAIEDSGMKSIDLELEEHKEMRGYLSGAEMKTYFTLQEQLAAKKKKAREEKIEAMKKAREQEKKEKALEQ